MTVSDKRVTVAVTAVGAIIGQGIVSSLRRSERPLYIIGIDRNADGIGRYFCDRFVAKPTYDEESAEYLEFWQQLATEEEIDLILPGLESDVVFFNKNRSMFNTTKTKVALNDPQLIELAEDKWDMGSALLAHNLHAIPSTLETGFDACIEALGSLPMILKPRRGNGSRGITVIRDKMDFDYAVHKCADDFMLQKYIGNDEQEYTVGMFGFGDGTGLPPITFRRKLSLAGNTQYAEVVELDWISHAVAAISAIFKPLGPTNFQFRAVGEIPYLLEINPRFSSSTSLRAAFGYNESVMALDFYVTNIRPPIPHVLKGRGWRYSEDLVAT